MGKRKEKIYVIGHKNPDTDSICSAIAYADLRQKVTGQVHEAKRAGHVNDETAYVTGSFWGRGSQASYRCQTSSERSGYSRDCRG